jgi:hypothetical protein
LKKERETIMKKIRCYIRDLYHLAFVIGTAFATWKIVRQWRAGRGKKAGHDIDDSLRTAAEKLEKTANTLEKWADRHQGENLGKGLDNVVTDTKKTLDRASDLVQRTLNHAK